MAETSAPNAPAPGMPPLATWGRRIGALLIDWFTVYLVTLFILRDVQSGAFGWLSLVLFWLEASLGVALTGASFGQNLLKIQVWHVNGRPLSLFSALLRQFLVCLVIPPLVFSSDGRGLHDLWTRSGAFRRPQG